MLGVPTGGNFGIGKRGTIPKKCVRIRGPLLVDLVAASSPHACVTKTTEINQSINPLLTWSARLGVLERFGV